MWEWSVGIQVCKMWRVVVVLAVCGVLGAGVAWCQEKGGAVPGTEGSAWCVDCQPSTTSNVGGAGRHVRYGFGYAGQLRLWDDGTVYRPEYGPWVSFELSLTPDEVSPNGLGAGGWNSSVLSRVSTRTRDTGAANGLLQHRAGGGYERWETVGACDGAVRCRYQPHGINFGRMLRPGEARPGGTEYAEVAHLLDDARAMVQVLPEGGYVVYGGRASAIRDYGAEGYEAWISARVDRYGQALVYEYERLCAGCANDTRIRLRELRDATGKVTRFYYADTDPASDASVREFYRGLLQAGNDVGQLWTAVEDPYGRVARYRYQDLLTGLRVGELPPAGEAYAAVRDQSRYWRLVELQDVLGVRSQVRYRCGSGQRVDPLDEASRGVDTARVATSVAELAARLGQLRRGGECMMADQIGPRGFDPWQTQTPLGTYTYTRVAVHEGTGSATYVRRGYIVSDPAGMIERMEAVSGHASTGDYGRQYAALGGGQDAARLLGPRPAHIPAWAWARLPRLGDGIGTRAHWTHQATQRLLEAGRITYEALEDPRAQLPLDHARLEQRLYDRVPESALAATAPLLMASKQPLEGWVFYAYPPGTQESRIDYVSRDAGDRARVLTRPILQARQLDEGGVEAQYWEYNAQGQATLSVDAGGRALQTEYEANGRDVLLRRVARWEVGADGMGRAAPLEVLVRYARNRRGQLTRIERVAGEGERLLQTLGYQESAPYALEWVRDERTGRTLRYARMLLNPAAVPSEQVIRYQVTDADGRVSSSDYRQGWRIGQQDGAMAYRWYGHDAFGRPSEVAVNGVPQVRYRYDGLRQVETENLGNGMRLVQDTDHLLRPTWSWVLDGSGALLGYTYRQYDASGNLRALMDGRGQFMQWEHDLQGRPVALTDSDGQRQVLEYQALGGRVRRSLDARGVGRRMEYAGGSLTRVWLEYDRDGGDGTLRRIERVWLESQYDPVYGRLRSQTEYGEEGEARTREYRYDAYAPYRVREVEEPLSGDGAVGRLTLHLDYQQGQLAGWRLRDAGTAAAQSYRQYGFDNRGRVTSVQSEVMGMWPQYASLAGSDREPVIALGYDLRAESAGLRVDEVQQELDYADRAHGDRVTGYRYRSVAGEQAYPRVLLDGAQQVAYRLGLIDEGRARYDYDGLGRLRSEWWTQVGADGVSRTQARTGYGYDASGNRAHVWDLDESGATGRVQVEAGYGWGNRLETYQGRAVRHDAAGNITYDPSNGCSYRYDALNRLQVADCGKNKGDYSVFDYDATGQVRRIREYTGYALESDRTYVYVAGELAQVRDTRDQRLLRSIHGDGYVDYGFNADGKPVQNRFLMLRDQQGSAVGRMDQHGHLVERVDYDAWGRLMRRQLRDPAGNWLDTRDPNSDMPYGYAGYLRHPRSGLLFTRLRAYNPSLGRFTQKDPLGAAGGINLYAYAFNNPVNLVDLSGLDPGRPRDVRRCLEDIMRYRIIERQFNAIEAQRGGMVFEELNRRGVYANNTENRMNAIQALTRSDPRYVLLSEQAEQLGTDMERAAEQVRDSCNGGGPGNAASYSDTVRAAEAMMSTAPMNNTQRERFWAHLYDGHYPDGPRVAPYDPATPEWVSVTGTAAVSVVGMAPFLFAAGAGAAGGVAAAGFWEAAVAGFLGLFANEASGYF